MSIPYKQELLRKAVHLSSIWMPVSLYYIPKQFNVIMFGVFALLNILIEIAVYYKVSYISALYNKLFAKMSRARSDGKFHFSGAPPMYASACLTALCFTPRIAACGFTILILSDTAAALIGRKWGRHRLPNGKSLEGSLSFFFTGCLIVCAFSFVGHLPSIVFFIWLCGVCLACIMELFNEQIHIDDNFSIPLSFGLIAEIGNNFV